MSELEPKKTGGPVEVEIPQLKVQKKEKKGAGIVLPGAEAAGNAVVAGGTGAAKSGFAALFAGKIGAVAVAVSVGGAGLVGYGVMQQDRANTPEVRKPDLGGINSSISVGKRNAKGSKSLSYMAKAGEGELSWENPHGPKKAAKSEEGATEEELADSANAPSQADLMEQMGVPNGEAPEAEKGKPSIGRIDAKLSSEIGNSSAFGSKSIFSGGTGFDVARMKKGGPVNPTNATPRRKSDRGKLGNLRRSRGKLSGKNISTRGVKANRAMGQLKFAGRRSGQAAQSNSAGAAATYAEDAFGATSSEGGEIDAASGIGEDLPTIEAPGTGAPGGDTGGGGGGSSCPSNWTQLEGGGCEPPDLDGVNVTDYQDKLDAAKGMADQAEKLTTTALALLVIGAILVATGWMSSLGWALIAIGGLMLLMAQMMSSQSMNMGQQIADQHGQKDQGKIVERYGSNSDTHVNAGHEGEAWKESEMDSEMEDTKNATYTMDGGGSGGVQ